MGIWLPSCVVAMLIVQGACYMLNDGPRWGLRSRRKSCRRMSSPAVPEHSNRKKRKTVIVCSFVGSRYYGLQMDKLSPLPTIEYHISKALNKVGLVIESNQNDLSKIGWSRSSRTDKGVHAARVVLSGKLELDERKWLQPDGALPDLAAQLSKELPRDIKVMSVLKVNQGFRAREAGHWREYEYIMPLSVLTRAIDVPDSPHKSSVELPTTAETAISRLNDVLRLMEGSISFHNFHKLSPKALKETQRGHEKARFAAREANVTETGREGLVNKSSKSGHSHYFFDPWIKRDRAVQEKTRTVIYRCRADPEVASVAGQEMVRVRLVGQSFLLHQIRLMLGCAILITRGVMPPMTLDFALQVPKHVLFPMAPAEGLVLVNAGFNRNCNGMSMALDPSAEQEVDRIMMRKEEWEQSEAFKRDMIYPQIAADWAREGRLLEETFLTHCDRYHVPEALWQGEWSTLLAEAKEANRVHRLSKDAREASRVLKNVHDFREYILLEDEAFVWTKEVDSWLRKHEGQGNKRAAGVPFKIKTMPHKALLPNTLATTLAVHYQVMPGCVALTEALRGIATYVVTTPNMCENMNSEQLFRFVVEKGEASGGGLQFWMQQRKHSFIE